MEKERFCKYVAAKRKAMGLTQKDLADALSYTPQAISRFESLDSSFPLEFTPALCKTLDCSLDDLFLRKKEETHYESLPFVIEEIGTLLRKRREERNKSQEELASACGVSARSIRNYENGQGNVSFQFLESFCEALGILPSELVLEIAKEPEIVPFEQAVAKPPFRVGRTSIFATASFLLIFIGLALVPTFLKAETPNQQQAEQSIESSQVQSDSSGSVIVGKYGLEVKEGVPNYLKVDYEKETFSGIGDTISLSFADVYDGIEFSLIEDHSFTIEPVPSDEGFEIGFEAVGDHEATVSLLSAKNGQGSPLNIRIQGNWYYNVGFFSYKDNAPVYLPSDTDHRFPITRGIVHNDWKSEATIRLSDSNFVSFGFQLFDGNNPCPLDEGIEPYYMVGDATSITSRSSAHNWPLTIYMEWSAQYVEIPKQIEVDIAMVTGWVRVSGDEGEYWFALEPLVIHIMK